VVRTFRENLSGGSQGQTDMAKLVVVLAVLRTCLETDAWTKWIDSMRYLLGALLRNISQEICTKQLADYKH